MLQIPLFIALINIENVFVYLGFDVIASKYSQIYISRMIPGLFCLSLYDADRQYLNSMIYQKGVMLITTTTSLCHIPCCYFFTVYLEWGVEGTAYATTTTHACTFVLFLAYELSLSDIRKHSLLPLKDYLQILRHFQALLNFLKYCVSAIVLLCLEWWSIELLTFFTSFISVEATAIQIIIQNIVIMAMTPAYGL